MKKWFEDGASKCTKIDFDRYDEHWLELQEREHQGQISLLWRSREYSLIPTESEEYFDEKTGKKRKRCIHKEVTFIADYFYKLPDGTEVIEAMRCFQGKNFEMKKKLMKEKYNLDITLID